MGNLGSVKGSCKKAQVLSKVRFFLLVKIRLSIFMLSFLSWLVLGRKVGRLLRAQEACKKRVSVNKLESHYQIKRQMIVLCFGCPCPSPINQVLGQNKKKRWWALLSTLLPQTRWITQSRVVMFNGLFESPGNGHVAMIYFKHLGLGSCCSNHLDLVTT